jgi:hypothetical protein
LDGDEEYLRKSQPLFKREEKLVVGKEEWLFAASLIVSLDSSLSFSDYYRKK